MHSRAAILKGVPRCDSITCVYIAAYPVQDISDCGYSSSPRGDPVVVIKGAVIGCVYHLPWVIWCSYAPLRSAPLMGCAALHLTPPGWYQVGMRGHVYVTLGYA